VFVPAAKTPPNTTARGHSANTYPVAMAETLTAHQFPCSTSENWMFPASKQQPAISPYGPKEGVEESPITGFGKADPIGRNCAPLNDRWQG
jgi:hypothetical protein